MDLNLALQKIGLHKYESSVYLALLERGPSNAGPIISQTGLHRVFVYDALESLQKNDLVTYVIRRNRKVFQASPPSVLLQKEKERFASIESLLPHLFSLQQGQAERLQVRVLYGKEEFYKNLEALVESASRSDKIMRIIGGGKSKDFLSALGRHETYYKKIVAERKVKKYLLGSKSMTPQYCRDFLSEPGNQVKMMDLGLSSPTYTRITNEMTSIEIYGSDVMIIQILNKPVAEGFLDHFNLLWKRASAFVAGR